MVKTHYGYWLYLPSTAKETTLAGFTTTPVRIITYPWPDTEPPLVIATYPQDGAKDVPPWSSIYIAFSEGVVPGPAWDSIVVKDQSGVAIPVDKCSCGSVLYLNPFLDSLNYDTQYTVTIPVGAVMDRSGNKLEKAYSFSFTTRQY